MTRQQQHQEPFLDGRRYKWVCRRCDTGSAVASTPAEYGALHATFVVNHRHGAQHPDLISWTDRPLFTEAADQLSLF